MSRLSPLRLPTLALPAFPLRRSADGRWAVRKFTRGVAQRCFDRNRANHPALLASGARTCAVITTSKRLELEVL